MDLHEHFEAFGTREWQSDADGTVRLALIGLGWWTRDEAIPAVDRADNCEATVVVSGSQEKAERVAATTDSVRRALTYEEFREGAATDAYDAVYVCTPNARHLPYVEAAASFGKDVLCEKPMEASVERAERMVAACADAGVTLMVAYRMQTAPEIRFARHLLEAGFVGDPVHVLSDNSQVLLSMIDDPDQWRLDPDLAGDGTSVTDIGLYSINTTRFVLDADPVEVQSMMDSRAAAFADVPDERAAFSMRMDDGTLVACTTSQNASSSSSLRITGTEGQLHVEPAFHMESRLRVRHGDVSATLETPETNQMVEEFAFFADRVLTGASDYPDGEHGLVDMRTLRAVYDAAESGETTAIED